jgi:DtxR family Mn-dependent transcriptional regulator
VRLTEKGRKIAVQVVRRHRLSERLLTDILHVDWGKAHDVACKIEHAIDDEEILESIEKALGNPKTCPHGNPIPAKEGQLEHGDSTEFTPLWELNPPDVGIVKMITDEDAEMLQYLLRLGLVPGASVEVISKEHLQGLITIRLKGSAVQTINQEAASIIKVKTSGITPRKENHTAKSKSERNHVLSYAEYEH